MPLSLCVRCVSSVLSSHFLPLQRFGKKKKSELLSSELLTEATSVFDFLHNAAVCQTTPDCSVQLRSASGLLSAFVREPQHYLTGSEHLCFFACSFGDLSVHISHLLLFIRRCQPSTWRQTLKVTSSLLELGISPRLVTWHKDILEACL